MTTSYRLRQYCEPSRGNGGYHGCETAPPPLILQFIEGVFCISTIPIVLSKHLHLIGERCDEHCIFVALHFLCRLKKCKCFLLPPSLLCVSKTVPFNSRWSTITRRCRDQPLNFKEDSNSGFNFVSKKPLQIREISGSVPMISSI